MPSPAYTYGTLDTLRAITDWEGEKVNGADVLTETLNRLSKKEGVQTAIVLDRTTGAILRKTGDFTISNEAHSGSQNPGNGAAGSSLNLEDNGGNSNGNETHGGVEDLAAMVWKFVNSAGELVQGIDAEVRPRLGIPCYVPHSDPSRILWYASEMEHIISWKKRWTESERIECAPEGGLGQDQGVSKLTGWFLG